MSEFHARRGLPNQPGPSDAEPDDTGLNLINSRDLLGEHKAVLIEHDGRRYTLRETRNGKLILNA